MNVPADEAGVSDRAFALLQELLPQHLLSRGMHRLARSTRPFVRNALVRAVLGAYPAIDLREAAQPDPYAYPSFNAFFTRALRPGLRPLAIITFPPATVTWWAARSLLAIPPLLRPVRRSRTSEKYSRE